MLKILPREVFVAERFFGLFRAAMWGVLFGFARVIGGLAELPTGPERQWGMAQGKRISSAIGDNALESIKQMGAAAKLARTSAGESQTIAAARLGVHIQTIARIESGEPGVAIGHALGMLAQYGVRIQIAEVDLGLSASRDVGQVASA